MGGEPKLSVVVPFYGVEKYIVACMESLQRQTLTDFEVVLVDDGSPDGSYELAKAFCATDDRFRIVRQENAGLGPARNTGARHAQGQFLTFVDSDDVVPRGAYQRMVGSLEETGSDLAAGNARRFNRISARDSWSHAEPFAVDRPATSLAEFPLLGMDRMAWNKVYDRRFFDAGGYEFPGILYEDYPVVSRANATARAIDVIHEPVYYWRERDGGDPSITQRHWELGNVRDRVTSAQMVMDVLAGQSDAVIDVVAGQFLHIDLAAVVGALAMAHPDETAEIMRLSNALAAVLPERILSRAKAYDRLQYHLVREGDQDRLRTLLAFRTETGINAPLTMKRFPRRALVGLPFQGDKDLPERLFTTPLNSINVNGRVLDGHWDGGRLMLDLAVQIEMLPMADNSTLRMWLEDRDGRTWPVTVERYRRHRAHFGHDLSGARVRIDPHALLRAGARRRGFLTLMAEVRTRGFTRTGPVRTIDAGRARVMTAEPIGRDTLAQPQRRPTGFGLWFRPLDATVTDCVALGDEFELTGTYEHDGVPGSLGFQLTRRDEVVRLAAEDVGTAGPRRLFRVRVPAAALVDHADHVDSVVERTMWVPRLLVDEVETVMSINPERYAGGVVFVGSRSVEAARTDHGNLAFFEAHAQPMVFEGVWEGQTLVLRGQAPPRSSHLRPTMLRFHDGQEMTLPVDGSVVDGAFEIRIDPRELIAAGDRVDDPHTVWWPFLGPHRVQVARAVVWGLPGPRRIDGHRVQLQPARGDLAQISIS